MSTRENASDPSEAPTAGNALLLLFLVWSVFVVPVFPKAFHPVLYPASFTAVFFAAVLAVQRGRRTILLAAVITTSAKWIARFGNLSVLFAFSEATILLFFALVVFRLIAQTALAKRVNALVILESINGYLLLGFFFSVVANLVWYFSPSAFALGPSEGVAGSYRASELIYFTFVTMTTLGYGDVLPEAPLTRSLATLIAVAGQLYIAVIIAMLIGKLAGGAPARDP